MTTKTKTATGLTMKTTAQTTTESTTNTNNAVATGHKIPSKTTQTSMPVRSAVDLSHKPNPPLDVFK